MMIGDLFVFLCFNVILFCLKKVCCVYSLDRWLWSSVCWVCVLFFFIIMSMRLMLSRMERMVEIVCENCV